MGELERRVDWERGVSGRVRAGQGVRPGTVSSVHPISQESETRRHRDPTVRTLTGVVDVPSLRVLLSPGPLRFFYWGRRSFR